MWKGRRYGEGSKCKNQGGASNVNALVNTKLPNVDPFTKYVEGAACTIGQVCAAGMRGIC